MIYSSNTRLELPITLDTGYSTKKLRVIDPFCINISDLILSRALILVVFQEYDDHNFYSIDLVLNLLRINNKKFYFFVISLSSQNDLRHHPSLQHSTKQKHSQVSCFDI